jgi:hypothetical protein
MSVHVARCFAEPIARLSLGRTNRGVVAVDNGAWHSRAVCSCGWEGRPHLLLAVAVHDAHLHSAQNLCRPAVPLMARDMSRQAFPCSSN